MPLATLSAKVGVTGLLSSQPAIYIPMISLAGGGAATSFVILETTQNYSVSTKLVSWTTSLTQLLSQLSQGTPSSSANPFQWLIAVKGFFSQIYNFAQQNLTQIGNPTLQAIQWLFETSKSFELSILNDLKDSLGDTEELRDLFYNIFTKSPNFIRFLTDSTERKSLTKLFEQDKLQKTKDALKVFSGKKDSFQVERGVSVYLVKELIRDPKNVSKKIERFVDLIDTVKKNIQGEAVAAGASTGSPSQESYILTKKKMQSFLNERRAAAQDGWEWGFLLEVGAKKQGINLGPLSTLVFSGAFSLFDMLSPSGSQRQ